jgi:orotate phosphoribosyltransferase
MVMMNAAARAADILLDIRAVHVNAGKPFMLTSGRASPVYIDCRKLIAFLPERREVIGMAADLLRERCDISKIDYVAGGETAGIPYAAWVSEALDKPMLYVRKKPKGFGRGAQIEGEMREGAHVLLVEDQATDGASKLVFADAIRAAGGTVSDVFCVFFYGIFPRSTALLGGAGLSLHQLATWKDVLAALRRRKAYSAAELDEVEKFLADPEGWSLAHGGVAA